MPLENYMQFNILDEKNLNFRTLGSLFIIIVIVTSLLTYVSHYFGFIDLKTSSSTYVLCKYDDNGNRTARYEFSNPPRTENGFLFFTDDEGCVYILSGNLILKEFKNEQN
jgi:hypothetical protein